MRVEAEWGAEELLERLLAAAPPELRLTPLEVEDRARREEGWGIHESRQILVLAVAWTPPAATP